MKKIIFPKFTGQRYYDLHYKYILNLFQYLDYEIEYQKVRNLSIKYNNKWITFDYADYSDLAFNGDIILKFHYDYNKEYPDNVFPFTPISFYDWNQYFSLQKRIEYTANGIISCRQRPYGNATDRRFKIQKLLKINFNNVENFVVEQEIYWKEINNCQIVIFVPGQNNNMLDRGQLQYMAFGCCTISPRLPEQLPFKGILIPGKHYIKCEDDYSDLIELINWYKKNPESCIEIGKNAKNLFQNHCTPNILINHWLEYILAFMKK